MLEKLPEDECCGCMACVNVCPKDIIGIRKDILGFSYPHIINSENCINCNQCNTVCPCKNQNKYSSNVGEVLCAYNKDDNERVFSSSGGIFPLLCKRVLKEGGVCYGVSFQNDFQTHFQRVDRLEELHYILSSKYTEADMGLIYRQVKADLLDGKQVVFSGSPCQTHALKNYLGRDYTNLLLIDLFCYGIPSTEVWKKWLLHISNGRQPVFVDFRDKTHGWHNYSLRIDFSDGTSYCEPKAHDKYIATFSKGAYIRKSCYNCQLKAFPRVSDITLGDFQELKEVFPEAIPDKGWSMVKINSDRGKEAFDSISNSTEFYVVSAEKMDSIHPGIGLPSPMHPNRMYLEQHIDDTDIESLLTKYASLTAEMKFRQSVTRIKHKTKNILQKIGLIGKTSR